MSKHFNPVAWRAKNKPKPITAQQRVWALIRAPLTPWIREQTIQSLMADPETREETIVQLNLRRELAETN
jgi:hypothetical protein